MATQCLRALRLTRNLHSTLRLSLATSPLHITATLLLASSPLRVASVRWIIWFRLLYRIFRD